MGKLKAHLIMEIMGRPPRHIKEALNTVVVKMGSEKGVSLIDKKYHEPKSVKDVKNLYLAFAEIDAEFDSLENFFAIVLGYMPSNVEIYDPEKFKINSSELNSLANYIISKLHTYDNIAKRAMTERDLLLNQLQYLKEGGKIEDLIKELKGGTKRPKLKKKVTKNSKVPSKKKGG